CLPIASVEVVHRGNVLPPAGASVPWPMLFPPSRKVTMPLGLPLPGEITATVAVKVTACPEDDGLVPELTAVLVPAGLTDCPPERVPLLPTTLPLPAYVAVIV